MQHLNTILRKLAKEYGIEGGEVLNSLRQRWCSLVGNAIAAHTFPESLKNRILSVLVDTPQWMHHLSFFKDGITAKLKPYHVGELRFRIGRIPEQSTDEPTMYINDLSEDDVLYIENTLKSLKSEELKEKFRMLIEHGLTRGKK